MSADLRHAIRDGLILSARRRAIRDGVNVDDREAYEAWLREDRERRQPQPSAGPWRVRSGGSARSFGFPLK